MHIKLLLYSPLWVAFLYDQRNLERDRIIKKVPLTELENRMRSFRTRMDVKLPLVYMTPRPENEMEKKYCMVRPNASTTGGKGSICY